MKKKLLLLFSFTILTFLPSKAQSDCSNAVVAVVGVNTAGTIGGTLQDICGQGSATFAEWYMYTSTTDGVLTITSDLAQNDGVTNSDDTYLNVYSGTCSSLTCIGYNDDTQSNYLSEVTFAVQSGQTYYFEWTDEWSSDGFDFEISVTPVTCPVAVTPNFTESFTDINSIYVCWDFIDSDGDSMNWFLVDYDADDDGNPDGNPCLSSASYDNSSGNALQPDNWVISYPIDLSGFMTSDNVELSWLARGIDVNWADENYTVYVASGNQVSDFLASSVTFNEVIGQNGGAGVFVPRTLDISSLAGQTVYVAFRHHNVTDQFQINIDDVAVTGTLSSSDFLLADFKHYYNASTKELTISSENENINTIEIYNTVGQSVYNKSQIDNATEVINMSNVSDGVYLITVSDVNNKQKKIKVIKN